jgi:hydrogenase expression/formation protein HypE
MFLSLVYQKNIFRKANRRFIDYNQDNNGGGSTRPALPGQKSPFLNKEAALFMTDRILPLGKLPPDLLAQVLAKSPVTDPRVILGPGVGMDCAVVDAGRHLLVFKSEPITFVTNSIGWYAVQVSVNDVATTGADPRWMLTTLLLPEGQTTPEMVWEIGEEIFSTCRSLGISVIGGHTEITHGLVNPILVATLIGEVDRERLITPRGASDGDIILLTKGVPVEGTAILAQEFPERLKESFTPEEITRAARFLYDPGISVLRDAQIAVESGEVTAMHDPTEGGLAAALWELSEASNNSLTVDMSKVHVPDLSSRICRFFGLDPYATIASGALLLTCKPSSEILICQALQKANISCVAIGRVEAGEVGVWHTENGERSLMNRPIRDEITRVFEQ